MKEIQKRLLSSFWLIFIVPGSFKPNYFTTKGTVEICYNQQNRTFLITTNQKKKSNDGLIAPFTVLPVRDTEPAFRRQPSNMKNANSSLQKRLVGDPLANLPPNIEALTSFGERADISPDNKNVAFMAKTFGDAMVINVRTKNITCLTCNVPAAAFVRVMHLSNGDYLLIGPDQFKDAQTSKRNNDLWYLNKKPGSLPEKIGQKVSEGVAISKTSLKIAFTEMGGAESAFFSKLVIADLDITDGTPKLLNKKTVLESAERTCTVEAQDFYASDSRLIFFCYISNGAFDVKGIDLSDSRVTNFSNAPNAFNEPEGIFPDGKYTTVEMDRQCEWLGGQRGSSNIDIWKMKLDGTGKNLERITHFNDYEGGKAANPVVSTDGKFMAFQAARSSDPPGMGHGVLIYWFKAKPVKASGKTSPSKFSP